MHLLALALGLLAPSIPDFDALAKARNVDALIELSGPKIKTLEKPFNFLRVNGPYGTGRHGWSAIPLNAPNGEKYVVFSTKITSEDYGEFVFTFDGSKLSSYIPETDPLGYRIEHQKMDIRFDPPHKSTSIVSEVSFKRTSEEKPGFLIRMSPQYRISSIKFENGSPVPYIQAGGVTWIRSGGKERFKYSIAYQGVVDLPLYAGSITTKEATLTNDYWYPMIARLPATFETTTHVPPAWTAVAQGELVQDKTIGTERVVSYRMDLPCTYWSLSAGPYKHFGNTINGRKYQVWSLTMTPETMKLQTELYAPILEFYSTHFSPYPFSVWGALDSPQYGGGALEAYSYATYGGGLPSEDAHEPSHTWWGGIIVNTYLHSLWNESFANFCSALYLRESAIGNRLEKRLAFVADATPEPPYLRLEMSHSGALSGPLGSTLGYGKGAKVMQMLEMELGTQELMKAMAHWIKIQPKGEPGEWEDFERAIEESSGKKVKLFFDEWVRRPGYADFEIQNLKWENGKLSGEAVFASEKYHLLMDVMLERSGGEREFRTLRLEPVGKTASFSVDAPEKPVLASFDPWRKLLRRYGPDEVPIEIESFLLKAKRYTDPAKANWLSQVRTAERLEELPSKLDGLFIVGSPETLPAMRSLCEKAGFRVQGSKLSYDGTDIDLNHGAAMAIVPLEGGGACAIGLGTVRRRPNPGRARLVLTDDLGRFLRGVTEPKAAGFLTYKL